MYNVHSIVYIYIFIDSDILIDLFTQIRGTNIVSLSYQIYILNTE